MALPLSGIRVIDLTTVAFGPLASQILGEQGAEVIKIETPGGDSTRTTGPARNPGMAAMFLALNRNKKSVCLDLKTREGQAALHELVKGAHVFVHNVRERKLAAIGADYETLKSVNSNLVYAALIGFRPGGNYEGRPAYDDVIQGMTGVVDMMDRGIGEPRYFPTIAADKICGVYAAQAITSALVARALHGRGSYVEVPMFETMVSFNAIDHWYGRHFDPAPEGFGYGRVTAPWRRPFETQDGLICCMPYTDAHWRRLWTQRGRNDLAADNRFSSMDARTRHIGDIYNLLQEELRTETSAYWLDFCSRYEVPAGPVLRMADLEHDPHLAKINFFETLHHPTEGPLFMPGISVRFDGETSPIGAPPTLGQHDEELARQSGSLA